MIIGVTGSLSTGKSTTSRMLQRCLASMYPNRKVFHLDADKIVHHCYQKNHEVYHKVVRCFGEKIVGKNREIDRQKLGAIIFKDKNRLRKLVNIVHPYVRSYYQKKSKEIYKKDSRSILIYDVPLLFESGIDRDVDLTVVITTSSKQQTERAKSRFKLTESELEQRATMQLSLTEKVKRADFVISTSGTLDETKVQVQKLCQQLKHQNNQV